MKRAPSDASASEPCDGSCAGDPASRVLGGAGPKAVPLELGVDSAEQADPAAPVRAIAYRRMGNLMSETRVGSFSPSFHGPCRRAFATKDPVVSHESVVF